MGVPNLRGVILPDKDWLLKSPEPEYGLWQIMCDQMSDMTSIAVALPMSLIWNHEPSY